jgi:hypothetical protein
MKKYISQQLSMKSRAVCGTFKTYIQINEKMDIFLDALDLLKLNQEDINHLNIYKKQ